MSDELPPCVFQMHEMLQLLQQDGADSETGSYTDSGRGPSEEGDNANHVNALDHHNHHHHHHHHPPGAVAPPAAAAAGLPSAAATNHDTSKSE